MKTSRVKAFLFILGFIPLIWVSWKQSLNVINRFNHYSELIKVSGAINDASSFAFAWLMFVVSILMILCFITGKKLLWIPKIVLMVLGGITVFAFFLGWGMNITLKEKLSEQGYVECKSKRELTLKYSSRTYALDPSLCEEDE